MPKLTITAAIIVGLAVMVGGRDHAMAAPQTGITISPFLQQIDIAPTDTAKTFQLNLTNNTPNTQELGLTAQDFGSLNDTGGILFAGSTNEYSQKYGLTSWLTLSTNTVTIEPGQTKTIDATVDNRDSLQPGGHYGAIVASVRSDDGKGSNSVQLNQQLTSLVLATKRGGERYDLALKEVAPNGNWLHPPNSVRLRFQNPGNVHVIPRGTVSLKNSAGKTVASGIINDDSAYVLPETYRQMYVRLTPARQLLPGAYTVAVEYRYDGIAAFRSRNVSVFFIGLQYYAIGGIILVLGIVYIRRNCRRRTAGDSR